MTSVTLDPSGPLPRIAAGKVSVLKLAAEAVKLAADHYDTPAKARMNCLMRSLQVVNPEAAAWVLAESKRADVAR